MKTLFLAALVSSTAFASSFPISSATSSSPTFDDVSNAAIYGMSQIPQENVEYGGSIVKCGDKIVTTEPVTENQQLSVQYETSVPKSFGKCDIVGYYHSHPKSAPMPEYFSSADVMLARSAKVPVYMLNQQNGEMRVFVPKKTSTTALKISGHLVLVSKGEEI